MPSSHQLKQVLLLVSYMRITRARYMLYGIFTYIFYACNEKIYQPFSVFHGYQLSSFFDLMITLRYHGKVIDLLIQLFQLFIMFFIEKLFQFAVYSR